MNPPIEKTRIMLIDDSADDRSLIRDAILRAVPDAAFIEPHDRQAFEQALSKRKFHLVVSEVSFRWGDGSQILKGVKDRCPDCYVIFFTGCGNEQLAVAAMKNGLDDYIVKSKVNLESLATAVLKCLENKEKGRNLRHTKEGLRERTMERDLFFDKAEIPFFSIDRNFIIHSCNRAVRELLGLTDKEIVGRKCLELLHGTKAPPRNCPAMALLRGCSQKSITAEETVGDRVYRVTCVALKDEAGRIYKIAHFMTDITNLKETQRLLRTSEKQYFDLLENANDLIQSIASDGSVIYANKAWRKKLGYELAELKGLSIFEVIHPDSRAHCIRIFQSLEKGFEPQKVYAAFQSKTGEKIETEGHITIRFQEGRLVYTRGIFRDITTEKQIAREKEGLQRQLIQAQKLEALGSLAGGIAHDFNNLLTSIMGSAQLASLKLDKDHPANIYLRQTVQACERSANLVRQLLLFSKKKDMQIAPVDLNKIINDLLKMIRRLIGENIDVITSFMAEKPIIHADVSQIEQIIVNLAVNARDAMPTGGKLRIRTRLCNSADKTKGQDCDFVCLEAEDTGCGMDETVLKNIFDPFFTTKEEGKGTGLGLSVVYGIVKRHGGTITVKSTPGKGSLFSIQLPLAKGEA